MSVNNMMLNGMVDTRETTNSVTMQQPRITNIINLFVCHKSKFSKNG